MGQNCENAQISKLRLARVQMRTQSVYATNSKCFPSSSAVSPDSILRLVFRLWETFISDFYFCAARARKIETHQRHDGRRVGQCDPDNSSNLRLMGGTSVTSVIVAYVSAE